MLIDGQEISPEYEKALKAVNVSRERRRMPGGNALYGLALKRAVSVKQKEIR